MCRVCFSNGSKSIPNVKACFSLKLTKRQEYDETQSRFESPYTKSYFIPICQKTNNVYK